MSDQKEVKLGNTGEIELPRINVEPYVGKRAAIDTVTEYEGVNKFKGGKSYYIIIRTKPLATIPGSKGKDGKPIELRASKLMNLHIDSDGKVGWGAETKLGLFLKRMKVTHYNQLVGKEVLVQLRTSEDGTQFLTFE